MSAPAPPAEPEVPAPAEPEVPAPAEPEVAAPAEPEVPAPAEPPAADAEPWYANITEAKGMEPDPRRFHKPNVYALGVLCNIVYEDMDCAEFLRLAQLVNPGFTEVQCFDEGNAQAAIFYHPDFLCVVFRGTSSDDPDDGSDWGSNLEALMELVEILHLRGRVHTGFWKYADMLWCGGSSGAEGLESVIKRATDEKPRPIMVAGHSLGGAAAVLGAMRIISLYGTDEVVSQLCTYGQPRCMGHLLARKLSDTMGPRYCRVVKGVDVVPMVPPSIGYAHGGVLYFVDEDGLIKRNPNWWKMTIDRLQCWWQGGGGWFDAELSFVSDHSMTDYWHLVRDAPYEHEVQSIAGMVPEPVPNERQRSSSSSSSASN